MSRETLAEKLSKHVKYLRAERMNQLQIAKIARERADWLDEEAFAVERLVDEETRNTGGSHG